jgi:hypothetical protein
MYLSSAMATQVPRRFHTLMLTYDVKPLSPQMNVISAWVPGGNLVAIGGVDLYNKVDEWWPNGFNLSILVGGVEIWKRKTNVSCRTRDPFGDHLFQRGGPRQDRGSPRHAHHGLSFQAIGSSLQTLWATWDSGLRGRQPDRTRKRKRSLLRPPLPLVR